MAATKLAWSIGSEPGLATGAGEGDGSGDVADTAGDGEAATPDDGGLAGVAVAQAAQRLSAAKTAARPGRELSRLRPAGQSSRSRSNRWRPKCHRLPAFPSIRGDRFH